MIDMFTLLLVHGILFLALYRLMVDDTVDSEVDVASPVDEDATGA
ncbi:hypothetical protein [Erythrobacter litoralis]|uniref:Uncharacterized protein n=1 Tax=Erythrobacter litoralis (strain HTCC2594) TaxID=314225 RepID=Q2N727_ERYLH|nr:hypothetical protein [Erythrobacter litoralis]ABC64514.1 hypothetical protein ELI_12110 [Erythrobacter litoralis HTCC2594]